MVQLNRGTIATLALCAFMTGGITGSAITYIAFPKTEPAVSDLDLKALLEKQLHLHEKDEADKAAGIKAMTDFMK
jgi:hypothetical protein